MKVQIYRTTKTVNAAIVSEPIYCEDENSNLSKAFISVIHNTLVLPGDIYTVRILDDD